MNELPQSVKSCLWSYDTDKLDLEINKGIIIFNVLNFGNAEAVKWLFETYKREEIVEVAVSTSETEWSKKSLNYWKNILGFEVVKKFRIAV
jgi:hypothetical protein